MPELHPPEYSIHKLRIFFTDDYECNEPLLHKAQLKATSHMPGREPKDAQLNGKYLPHVLHLFNFTRTHCYDRRIVVLRKLDRSFGLLELKIGISSLTRSDISKKYRYC